MSLWSLYEEVWAPFNEVLSAVARRGIYTDELALEVPIVELGEAITELEERLNEEFGPRNWDSWQQIAKLLYEELRYPIPEYYGSTSPKRTPRDKRPTDKIAISSLLKGRRDPLQLLLDYKLKTKQRQQYVTLANSRRPDGRIYSQLSASTKTGRLSSRNPNLQNVSKGGSIRGAFRSKSGYWLVVFDYSQLECYVIAHYAYALFGDDSLLKALQSGDIHTWVAQQSGLSRQAAKAVTYGLAYGKTAMGLGYQLTTPEGLPIGREAAQRVIDTYEETLPAIPRMKKYFVETARKELGARTLLGRWRALPDINDANDYDRWRAERQAINTPIQGTATDVVAKAMIACEDIDGCDQILQVHDELIFETEDPDLVIPKIKACMEGAFPGMMLRVDHGIGNSWLEAK